MSNGSMALSDSFFSFFCNNVKEGSTILEFGSGAGTKRLVENGFIVYSIEENERFVGNHHDNYYHAKIINNWYDLSVVKTALNEIDYDVILIDGPAGGDRRGFNQIYHLVKENTPLFVDDIERKQDRELFESLCVGREFEDKKYYGLIK